MKWPCFNSTQLSAYIDGELSPAARQKIEAHLEDCAACAALLQDLRALQADFRVLEHASVGFDLAPAIQGRLAGAEAQGRPAGRRFWPYAVPLSLAAGIATLALGFSIGNLLLHKPSLEIATPTVAMTLFDPVPLGGVCIGDSSCYPDGKI